MKSRSLSMNSMDDIVGKAMSIGGGAAASASVDDVGDRFSVDDVSGDRAAVNEVTPAELSESKDDVPPTGRAEDQIDEPQGIPQNGLTSSMPVPLKPARKRKTWFNAFNPTYKKRANYFKKIFRELPQDEMLIVDYSCALQRDILVQGRMYLSTDHICFYGNIIIWETARLCLPFRDIVAITKEKAAMVIPNAVEIRMKDGKKYFFASFTGRDKAYLMMFRAWQNRLLDHRLSQQDLWAWVKQSYGNDLGLNSDDSDENSLGANGDRKNVEGSMGTISDSVDEVDSMKSAEDIINFDEDANDLEEDDDQANASTTSIMMSKRECRCKCEGHPCHVLIDRVYKMEIKYLFECLFSENTFSHSYRKSRRLVLDEMSEWNEVVPGDARCVTRRLKYSVRPNLKILRSVVIKSVEKQTLHRVRDSCITVESELFNSNVPYSDTFFILTKYCLVELATRKTALRICCEIKYLKSIWGMTRGVIEQHTLQALQDTFQELDQRLKSECYDPKKDEGYQKNQNAEAFVADKSKSIEKTEESESENRNTETVTSDYFSTVRGLIPTIPTFYPSMLQICLFIILVLVVLSSHMFMELRRYQSSCSPEQKQREFCSSISASEELHYLLIKLARELKQCAVSRIRSSEFNIHELARTVDAVLMTMSELGDMIIKSANEIRLNVSNVLNASQHFVNGRMYTNHPYD